MSPADIELLFQKYPNEIMATIAAAFVLVGLWRSWGRLERQEDQQAQRRLAAVELGFEVPGASWLATLADGPTKFGRFPLFEGHPRVRLLFEGERRGLKLFVFSHKPVTDYEKEPTTTVAYFGSPEIDVPEFRLTPSAGKFSPEVEKVFDFIGKGFAKVFGPPDPEIAFPGRPRFGETYTLTSTFTVRIRDAFTARALDSLESHPGWTVEGANGRLLVYRDDVEEPAERMGAFVDEAMAVAELFRKPTAAATEPSS